ncbi:MAG: hypothetical protein WC788_02820 [Candidatus Paceibacterota bacterium]|jgi:hypothetical protein
MKRAEISSIKDGLKQDDKHAITALILSRLGKKAKHGKILENNRKEGKIW